MKRHLPYKQCVRFPLLALLLVALALAACEADSAGTAAAVESRCPQPVEITDDQVRVLVSSSNTKELWMQQMADQFNEGDFTTERGQQIVVQVWHTGSSLDTACEPVAWSPSDETRIDGINQEWRRNEAFALITSDCPSTVAIPIGIAMWQPMAEALGWPEEDISWDDIIDLATDPEGWGSVGHPEWGRFRYGHGNPRFSTSGRLSVVMQIYAATGERNRLTRSDVFDEESVERVAAVQSAIGNYGRIDTLLLDRMAERGPTYLHAITNYEGNVVRWNQESFSQREEPWNRLAFIYPSDGTFWVDHPFCVLDNALWASPGQIEGARMFRDFIMERDQQEQLVLTGIRPAIDDVSLTIEGSPLTLENGVIPEKTALDVPPLEYPSASVMDDVIEMWQQAKKRVTVMIVFDRSQFMGDFMNPARDATLGFLETFHEGDEVLLIRYADGPDLMRPIDQWPDVEGPLRDSLNNVEARGEAILYRATMDGIRRVDAMRGDDRLRDEQRLYGVVLVTAGVNSRGDEIPADLYETLPDGTESDQVRVHIVAFGDGASSEVLQEVAGRTNGSFYGVPNDNLRARLDEAFSLISAEF